MMKLALSSQMMFKLGRTCSCFSISFSTANLRPNSISSILYISDPLCCMSWAADRDSSYFLISLPEANSNMRIWRSVIEYDANISAFGDKVIAVGTTLFCLTTTPDQFLHGRSCVSSPTFLNSYRSVLLLKLHIPGDFDGQSKGSCAVQVSIMPDSSADSTVSNRSEYWRMISHSGDTTWGFWLWWCVRGRGVCFPRHELDLLNLLHQICIFSESLHQICVLLSSCLWRILRK